MGVPMIVSGGRDTKICFWDVETGKLIREKETPRNIVTTMLSADGELAKLPGSESDSCDAGPCIIQASEDRRFRIWDVRVKDVVQEFGETQYFQLSMDLCRSRLVSGTNGFEGEGCQVQLWDLRALGMVDEHNVHSAKVVSVKFLPYGHSD
jgi:WD40 repeat protein